MSADVQNRGGRPPVDWEEHDDLVHLGYSPDEIAMRLGISRETLDTRRRRRDTPPPIGTCDDR